MTSEAQQQASRENGKKSRGPTTPEGKKKSSMNNLKHGLRSNQVVLPGESAEEFKAELKGWRDDWKPRSHTVAVIVERAATASWRLRRCVRAESDLLMELAERTAARKRRRNGDDSPEARVKEADSMLAFDPAGSLAELKSSPAGIDRLLARWADLAKVIAAGDKDVWSDNQHYDIMILLGHEGEGDAAPAGPLAADSFRLSESNFCERFADTLPVAEAEAVAARIGEGIARERAALVELRRELAAREADDDSDGVRDDDYRFPGVSHKIMLLHRYEMAHERSMRAALKDLVMLEKVRPELGRGADVAMEVVSLKAVRKSSPDPAPRSLDPVPPAPDEPEPGAASGGSEGRSDSRRERRRARRRARKARSRR